MKLADAYAISTGLERMYGLRLAPATIRSWAHRRIIGRHGSDPSGQTLYDLDEVVRHATRRAELQTA